MAYHIEFEVTFDFAGGQIQLQKQTTNYIVPLSRYWDLDDIVDADNGVRVAHGAAVMSTQDRHASCSKNISVLSIYLLFCNVCIELIKTSMSRLLVVATGCSFVSFLQSLEYKEEFKQVFPKFN